MLLIRLKNESSMNMKSRIFLLLASLSLMVSCAKDNAQETINAPTIEFSLEQSSKDLLKSIKTDFIKLELTKDSSIETIGQIIELGDTIVISDISNPNLLAFTKQGNFISTIGEKGIGPGEYINATSIFYDREHNAIGLYDEQNLKIIYYDASTFKYSHEQYYKDIKAGCCMPVGDGLIWYNEAYDGRSSDYYFLITDNVGKIKKEFVKKDFKSGYITGNTTCLYTVKDRIRGYIPYSTILYDFSNQEATPIYDLRFKGFDMPTPKELNKISINGNSPVLFKKLSESGYISYFDVVESNDLLASTVIAKKKSHVALLDKKTGERIFMSSGKFASKLGLGKFQYFVSNSINSSIIAILDSESLILKNGKKKNKLNKDLSELIARDSVLNPIVALIHK